MTILGTAGQVATGILGVDLPGDIRDITHDLTNWEWSWKHAGKTALDVVGVLPLVGGLKYTDEAAQLLKNSGNAAEAVKSASKTASSANDAAKTIDKSADLAKTTIKTSSDMAEESRKAIVPIKPDAGSNPSNFINEHAAKRHIYNPSTPSTTTKTQYWKRCRC